MLIFLLDSCCLCVRLLLVHRGEEIVLKHFVLFVFFRLLLSNRLSYYSLCIFFLNALEHTGKVLLLGLLHDLLEIYVLLVGKVLS